MHMPYAGLPKRNDIHPVWMSLNAEWIFKPHGDNWGIEKEDKLSN